MSQPKRYRGLTYDEKMIGGAKPPFQADLMIDPKGDLVAWDDYAALAAEREAETRATFDAIRLITQLREENERLRKAGDRLASATIIFEMMSEEDREQRRADWLAAKEGRDAK